MRRIQQTWAERTVAEYRSASYASELLHWLIVIAVSPDTLETCHRIVRDELVHAELSREVLLAAGGDEGAIAIDPAELVLWHEPQAPLHVRAAAVAADLFCCGETVAVPLFQELRAGATEAVAVRALDRILDDEPVHRGFGWQLLDELLERHDELRAFLQARHSAYQDRIRRAYSADDPACTDLERQWGLMAPSRYGEITERCISETIGPRFERRLNPTPRPD